MAVLAAAAALAVLAPLYRSPHGGRSERAQALAIYRDQLDEVDRDLGRGVIGETEAAAARTEIARRLLRAGSGASDDGGGGNAAARQVATVAIIAMPLAALAFYLWVGSPQLPAEPLAARLSAPVEQQDVATLVARVEAHLAANPEDGKGWEVLAPVYLRLGRYDDAVEGLWRRRAPGRLDGGDARPISARRWSRASGGTVTPRRGPPSSAPPPTIPRRRGRASIWRWRWARRARPTRRSRRGTALLADAPDDRILGAGGARRIGEARRRDAAPAPGPSAADVKAAGDMAPADRLAMIEGMVAQLAAKLDAEPRRRRRLGAAGALLYGPRQAGRRQGRAGQGAHAPWPRTPRRWRASTTRPRPRECRNDDGRAPPRRDDAQAAPPDADRPCRRRAGVAAGLILYALSDQIVFFNSPSDVVAEHAAGRHPHPPRRPGRGRQPGQGRRRQGQLRRHRRQRRGAGRLSRASCPTCSARGRASSPRACSTADGGARRRHRARQA